MILKIFFKTILFVLFFSLISCVKKPDDHNDNTPPVSNDDTTNAYILPEISAAIKTEYSTYRFLSNEQDRRVFVYGKVPSEQLIHVRVKKSSFFYGFGRIEKGENKYFKSNYYTTYIDVRGSDEGYYIFQIAKDDFTDTVFSTDAYIDIISNRDYNIEYSYMSDNDESYDIFSQGYKFESKVKNAFQEAHTTVTFDTNLTNISVEIFQDISREPLLQWGTLHATDGNNHNANKVILFSVKNYSDNSTNALGRTWFSSGDSPKLSFAYVFLQKIDLDLQSHTEQERKVTKTRIAIHELAHARGKDENYDALGDNDTQGIYPHNGKFRYRYCALIRKDLIFHPDSAFHFCEGHKQILLNTIFTNQ